MRPRSCLMLLAGCATATPPPAPIAHQASTPAPAWRCFVRDAAEPAQPMGDVTVIRQRLQGGALAFDSVHRLGTEAGATRLVFAPVGDHLEAVLGGVTIRATLDTPDASRWSLRYADPATGLAFSESLVIEGPGLTVTTIDPGRDGGEPVTRVVHFDAAPCAIVDAELARYR